MEPVGEELLGCGLAHSGDAEVVLLAGASLDSVFVNCADFVDSDLNAVAGVFGALEVETAGVKGELAGAAAEALVVTCRVDDRAEWNPRARSGRRWRRHRVRGLRECRCDVLGLRGRLLREGCR